MASAPASNTSPSPIDLAFVAQMVKLPRSSCMVTMDGGGANALA
jgi:hypothetical protein